MSKIKTRLITTSFRYLEQIEHNESEKYLLGDWCLQNTSDIYLETDKYLVQRHHWIDSQKYEKDFSYLDTLNDRLLLPLSIFLNKYHNVNYSTRYWRIILGPWLLTFIPTLFDRWETLRLAFDSNRSWEYDLFIFDSKKFVPHNFENYQKQSISHIWNSYIFSQILTFQYSRKVNFKIIRYEGNYPTESLKKTKFSFNRKALRFIDNLFSLIRVKHKVIFATSYLKLYPYIKLSLKLKQIPRIDSIDSESIDFKKPVSGPDRKIKLDQFNPENDFENFIQEVLFLHIPQSYLESYSEMKHEVSKIKRNGSIIFTANAHLENDFFNHWCARMVELGTLLVTSQHGGAFKQSKNIFSHQEKISDKMIVWHKPIESNHVRLSANKLIHSRSIKSGRELSIVALESQIYVYRAQTGIKAESLIDYNQKINFIKKLSKNSFQSLKVRADSRGEGWFNSENRYRKDLGSDKISNYKSFEKMLSNSKIVVCTYPLTTYLEAMFSGIPTIALYKKEHYKFSPIFDSLIISLEKNNMIFYDSESAANHINNIWNNPLEWWESNEVFRARKMFFDICGDSDEDWLDEWSNFFSSLS